MTDKYVTFSPYYAGLCNVLMSYELALGITHITNRKLVVPPKTFMAFLSAGYDTKEFTDIWQVLDRSMVENEFSIVDFESVPELNQVKDQICGPRSYTEKITGRITDLFNFRPDTHRTVAEAHTVFTNGKPTTSDHHVFSTGRPVVDLDRPEQFIHFEGCLFGHYFYHVYNSSAERNTLKGKIAKALRYKEPYHHIARRVSDGLGKYDALHIRRTDFLRQYTNFMQGIDTGDKLLSQVSKFKNLGQLPIYVATDEPDHEFFSELKSKYDLYFYEDFEFDLDPLEKAIVDQLICSNAEFFMGTKPSTYSARINRIRGEAGKQADDHMGINSILYTEGGWKEMHRSIPSYMTHPIPWAFRESKQWSWDDSTHPHWIKE